MVAVCLILLFLLAPGYTLQPAAAQETTFRFVEHLSIGDDEQAGAEYLFSAPRHVATDTDGNIYVVDGRRPEIRVFSPAGTYIKTLGGPGQGPGEFTHFSAMAIDQASGDVIVADNREQRFTVFAAEDQSPRTIPYGPERVEIGHLTAIGSARLATGIPRSHVANVMKPTSVVHIFSNDLRSVIDWTAKSDTWWDFSKPFSASQQLSRMLLLAVVDDRTFLLVPDFYDGSIYRYQKEGGEWSVDRIDGRIVDGPPMTVYEDVDDLSQVPDPKIIASGPAGRFVVIAHRRSRGLFVRSDGSIVHFTYEKNDTPDYSLWVELFDTEGQLVRTGRVEGYAEGASALGTRVLWKDVEDRFYVVDRRGDFPVLRAMTLEEHLD